VGQPLLIACELIAIFTEEFKFTTKSVVRPEINYLVIRPLIITDYLSHVKLTMGKVTLMSVLESLSHLHSEDEGHSVKWLWNRFNHGPRIDQPNMVESVMVALFKLSQLHERSFHITSTIPVDSISFSNLL
jgi:hypothetical protein